MEQHFMTNSVLFERGQVSRPSSGERVLREAAIKLCSGLKYFTAELLLN